jgi:hypothetical protein
MTVQAPCEFVPNPSIHRFLRSRLIVGPRHNSEATA